MWVIVLLLAFTAGCRRGGGSTESAYVIAPEVELRDRVAAVYNVVGKVSNGEEVRVLERDRRFVKVRSPRGEEGWVAERHLVGPDVFQKFEELAQKHRDAPVQARGVARSELNMRLEPGRSTQYLYRLVEGDKVEMLRRAVVNRTDARGEPLLVAGKDGKPAPVPEDWWLVRSQTGHVGWVLGRMVDVDVPLIVAQYAEGQRIVANFVLNEIEDDGRKVPQYLMVLTEPKDGLPFDFNQVRLFTWNRARDRYETAYRERKIDGALPVTVGQEEFPGEGHLPTFTVRARDGSGQVSERKYKLNGVMVRRVTPGGEQPGKG